MFSSLLIYGGIFAVSILFAFFYEISGEQKSKISQWLWTLLIILPVCLLAAFRGNVGTDTLVYNNLYQSWLKLINLGPYFTAYLSDPSTYIEPGYAVINRIAFLLGDDIRIVFFLSSFIQMAFIWKGIVSFRGFLSPAFSLFIYYLLMFNTSLNLIRQSLAVAVVFYAFQYIAKREFVKYLLFILLAATFHITALFTLFLYVFSFVKYDKQGLLRTVYYFFIVGSPLILYGVLQFAQSSGLLVALGFGHYMFQFTGISLAFLMYILPAVAPLGFYAQEMNGKIPNGIFGQLYMIVLMQIPLRFLTYFSTYAGRLEDYVALAQVILVSMLIQHSEKGNRAILFGYYIIWYVVFHVLTFVIGNSNETYPYVFGL